MAGRILYGGKSNVKADTRGLGAFYFDLAEKHDSKICQIDGDTGEKESFASVKKRSTRVAIEMRKRGITENDIILFCSKNNLNNAIPVLGAFYLGAIVASTDPSLSIRDTKHAICLVRPKFIFVEADSVKLIEDSLIETDCNPTIIVIGDSTKFSQFSEFQLEDPEEHNFKPIVVQNCHDTAIIFFSSGTTGLPKGICITHYGVVHGGLAFFEMNCMNTEVILHFSSLYWISTIMLMTVSFITGGHRVLSSKIGAEKLLQLIQEYKVSFIFTAPIFTYLLTSVKNGEKYDTSSLFSMGLVGTSLSEEQLERARKFLKHTHVVMGYGATEMCGCITLFDLVRDKDVYRNKTTSSGKVGKDVQLKIVDIDTREILGPNEKGEICVKSPVMMKGYYNMDSTSAYDEAGFIKTGDIGYYDDDEFIYVVDRIKEMFKYQSWHVVPASLEALLQEHPAVQEAVAFGIPHEIDGHHPAACVTLKTGVKVTVEELDKFVSDRVADVQKLRGGIKIVDFVKKTPTGKVQRNIMRDYFLTGKIN